MSIMSSACRSNQPRNTVGNAVLLAIGVVSLWPRAMAVAAGSAEDVERESSRPAQKRSYEPWPAELPLPAAAPTRGWVLRARIAQPVGPVLWLVVEHHKSWARKLRQWGFNTINLTVPDTHNAVADPAISPGYGYDKQGKFRIDKRRFSAAMESFRAAGLRTIMYSSLMHCGHGWAWESGQLAKGHPDWSQVDAEGHPVMQWGRPWLCPSSPAFDYCLDWTVKHLKRWKFDAVWLDNQFFQYSTKGEPTCYCKYCQAAFRRYVADRFGPERARKLLGVADLESVRIPTDANTELFRLWKHWRPRVWAEATERFRAALRRVKPEIALFSNVTRLRRRPSWVYASDLHTEHLDASQTEMIGLDSTTRSNVMLLHRALAGRCALVAYPDIWKKGSWWRECLRSTYVDGVFHDPTPLHSPQVLRTIHAIGLAHHVKPKVVLVGFVPPSRSSAAIVRQIRLADRYLAEAAEARRYAQVVSLFSTRQRDYLGGGTRSLLPPHLDQLRKAQIPTQPVRDRHLPSFDLSPYQALIAEGTACLSDPEVQELAKWVKAGGTLLATPDAGTRDEVGRERRSSLLAGSLGISPSGTHPVGRGHVVWFALGSDILGALRRHTKPVVKIEPKNPDWEVTVYRQSAPDRFWVHVIDHGHASSKPSQLTLRLPEGTRIAKATWWTDTGDRSAQMTQEGTDLQVALPPRIAPALLRATAEREKGRKRGQVQFPATARRVLRRN